MTKPFTGGQFAYEIDRELMANDVYSARDHRGANYLIAHTAASTWLCALVSPQALDSVVSGRVELRDAFRHTTTGLVERITVRDSVVHDDSLLLCRELSEDELPRPGVRLCSPAPCA
jgi:hypothetical protein